VVYDGVRGREARKRWELEREWGQGMPQMGEMGSELVCEAGFKVEDKVPVWFSPPFSPPFLYPCTLSLLPCPSLLVLPPLPSLRKRPP